MTPMAYKILRGFSFIYYGRINEFVLFFVNIRQKLEVESKHSESKHNIFCIFCIFYAIKKKNYKFLLIIKQESNCATLSEFLKNF